MIAPHVITETIDRILEREGGFVDHPSDKGGATKYGVTARALGKWRDYPEPATTTEVEMLTVEEARAFYRVRHVTEPGFDAISDPALFDLVVDCGVNHGVGRAARWLQEALGVKADGAIGPVTRAALARAVPGALYRAVLALRLRFYGRIITRDPSQATFAAGWMARAAEFVIGCPA